MSDSGQEPYLCGRLYATLQALCTVATGSSRLAETAVLDRASSAPRVSFLKHLQEAGEHLARAKERGAAHEKAAAELFRAIPDLIPSGGIPRGRFGNKESAAFSSGYTDQLAACKDRHGALLK